MVPFVKSPMFSPLNSVFGSASAGGPTLCSVTKTAATKGLSPGRAFQPVQQPLAGENLQVLSEPGPDLQCSRLTAWLIAVLPFFRESDGVLGFGNVSRGVTWWVITTGSPRDYLWLGPPETHWTLFGAPPVGWIRART